MRHPARILTVLLAASLMLSSPGVAAQGSTSGAWQETRFNTGCDPGPASPPPPPEHLETHYPPLGSVPDQAASVQVNLDPPASGRPLAGAGFNLEHALWSCAQFRGLFRSEVLDPFMPAI